jgi:1-acyl-sn-glycerol-3-phosphate acyltransferase/uncharacterized membrane protein
VALLTATVRRLCVVGVRLVYREIDVVAFGQPPTGPVLVASNHFGGFADAMLLIALSDRFPRIVARDVIWRVPLVGRLMRGIGAIPVARRADDRGVRRSNDEMFAACYDALAHGDLVLIFPEGVTQDDPFLAPVRTGAARITLGARAHGVTGIGLAPVGIHYEDKAAFRSRVLVAVGEPIDIDTVASPHDPPGRLVGADDPPAVRALTDLLDVRMRRVGPHYRDWEEARAMTLAATVALHELAPASSGGRPLPFGLVERLGAALATAPEGVRLPLQRVAAAYGADLTALGLDDGALVARRPFGPGRLLAEVVLLVVLAPLALLGVLLGAVPVLLARATRLLPAAPAVRATVMPLVALLALLAEWVGVTLASAQAGGWQLGAAAAVIAPVALAAAFYCAERAVLLGRGLRHSWHLRRADPVAALRARRADVLLAARRAVLAGSAAHR